MLALTVASACARLDRTRCLNSAPKLTETLGGGDLRNWGITLEVPL